MHLTIILSTLLAAATFTTATASPVSSTAITPRANGSVCGNAMIGYNTPHWEDHDLIATNSCQQLGMGIFLYSVGRGCRCRFYKKPGCNAKDRTLDATGPVPAKYANLPYESRWYLCNRV